MSDEWAELMDTVDKQIEISREKVESGRVYDQENERIRQNWHKRLSEALEQKRQLLKTAPRNVESDCWSGEKRLYIVSGGGLHKIGVSSDVDQRLESLQSTSPVPLELIFRSEITSEAYIVEQKTHVEFNELREHGEWFDLSSEQLSDVIQFIQSSIAKNEGGASA